MVKYLTLECICICFKIWTTGLSGLFCCLSHRVSHTFLGVALPFKEQIHRLQVLLVPTLYLDTQGILSQCHLV